MKNASLTLPRLQSFVERFPSARIAVIGDFFLDRYLDIDPALEELSVETGKPAHQVARVRCFPGAAGTVVSNLAALGAGHLHAIGFTGDDGQGFDLRKALHALGCSTDHLHSTAERYTPTYLKPRDMTRPGLDGEHSRYDTKNRRTTPEDLQQKIIQSLGSMLDEIDAVIILDQVEANDCGVITASVREAICQLAVETPRLLFWADSRRRIRLFRHVIIKPNQFEAIGNENPLPGDEVVLDDLVSAAKELRVKTAAPIFITRGEAGMLVSDPDWTIVPTVRVTGEIDPTGAGDSATAGAVLALCAGADHAEAAVVGNLVASITVQQLATTGTASPAQLLERHDLWQCQRSS